MNQTISQLEAIGAPTKPFVDTVDTVVGALVIAFGIGVWASAGRKRSLRITGMLVTLYGVLGFVEGPFSAMHLVGGVAANIVHLLVTVVNVLLITVFIGFGAAAHGKGFRLYSIATILIFLVFGALAGMQGVGTAQLSVPWMGVEERLSFYSWLLWILVFAVVRFRVVGKEPQDHIKHSMQGLQV
jgi:hypothetical protein